MRLCFGTALTLLITVFIVSCQKEITPFDPNATPGGDTTIIPQPGTNDSTGTGSDTTATGTGSYLPLTAGTWWKFKDSPSGLISTKTVLPVTKTFDGIQYTGLVTDDNVYTDTAWEAVVKPNYYLRTKGVSPSGSIYDITFNFLNDTASVGYSWTYPAGYGNTSAAYITTTILAKNITVTLNGKTYTDVTESKMALSYDIMGSIVDMGYYEYYVAKGIGIIKVHSYLSMAGTTLVDISSDIMDYNIQ